MLKTLLIIAAVLGVIVGGLLSLRNSRRTGMPGPDVLQRAAEREKTLRAEEDSHKDA